MRAFKVDVSNKYHCFRVHHIVLIAYLNFYFKFEIMAYSNPMESALFRRIANGELSAQEVSARAVANPDYLCSWEVCQAAQEISEWRRER